MVIIEVVIVVIRLNRTDGIWDSARSMIDWKTMKSVKMTGEENEWLHDKGIRQDI